MTADSVRLPNRTAEGKEPGRDGTTERGRVPRGGEEKSNTVREMRSRRAGTDRTNRNRNPNVYPNARIPFRVQGPSQVSIPERTEPPLRNSLAPWERDLAPSFFLFRNNSGMEF